METASLGELPSMRSGSGSLVSAWPWMSTASEEFATAALRYILIKCSKGWDFLTKNHSC